MPSKRTPRPMGLLCLAFLLAVPTSGLNCNLLKRQQQRMNRQSMELLKGMKARLPAECLPKMPALSFPIKILEIQQPRSATKAVLEILQGFLHLLKDDHRWDGWEATLRKRGFVSHPKSFFSSVLRNRGSILDEKRNVFKEIPTNGAFFQKENWTLFCLEDLSLLTREASSVLASERSQKLKKLLGFLENLHEQTQSIQRCLEEGKPTPGKSKEEGMHKLQLKKYFRSIRNFLEEKGLDRCTQEFIRHELQVDFMYMDKLTEKMKT